MNHFVVALNWLSGRFVFSVAFLAACHVAFARAEEQPDFETQVVPILKTYCYECHGGGEKEGDLALDQFSTADEALARSDLWWNVLKNVRSQLMPPVGHDRPSPTEAATLANWIKFRAFEIDPDNVDPGQMAVRRLNRTEYGNTVSDLMGIRFDATILFPPDDAGFGFDNVGDALSFSPLLMEKYLHAAQSIVDRAIPKATWIVPAQEFSGRDFRDSDANVSGEGLSSTKPAHLKRTIAIKTAGKYKIEVAVKLHGSFEFDPSRYTVAFRIDGQNRSTNEYGWDESKLLRYEFSEDWTAGDHELSFELTPLPGEKSAEPKTTEDSTYARFEVNSVRIEGPEGTTELVHPPNYTRFFPRDTPPADAAERHAYAEEILRKFATRAFRSRVKQATLDRLVTIAELAGKQPGATFESGIAQAMTGVLASPRFLFRLESSAEADAAKPFADVDELDLASRLSYFLWSTMPDEELFELAQQGQLRNQLSAQVARMMRDRRSNEFLRNFVGQWLRTRDVTQATVDPIAVLGHQKEYEALLAQFRDRRGRSFGQELTPEEQKTRDRFRELRKITDDFDDELKRAMQRETELCVEHIAHENLSLLDLLDCNYTFVNEKLAKHYGLPDVQGDEMRLVELPPESVRGGVLCHASMLLITSNPTRTSPVKRGLFILDNILGTPAPPAPPGVPALEAAADKFGDREPTLRELLTAHRESALCASCHARMDPLGLALENFNALGSWRTEEKGAAIDGSGTLITGESFQDVRELKHILREQHADDFYRCVTQKMLTFAIGRGLEQTDEHTVDLIVERLQNSGGKFSDLIDGVIASAPFQKIRNPTQTRN
ncbi:MAG: DUF1592 domain-containing protein [Fuerstia sp.]|nr:DUF1592 domain-containing protein [Fuerstiella sp.]